MLLSSGIPRFNRSSSASRSWETAFWKSDGEVELSVNAGRPMDESMKANPIFSRLMVQMVASGIGPGQPRRSLQHVSVTTTNCPAPV